VKRKKSINVQLSNLASCAIVLPIINRQNENKKIVVDFRNHLIEIDPSRDYLTIKHSLMTQLKLKCYDIQYGTKRSPDIMMLFVILRD
jgi:hypothetical protein